MRAGQVPSYNLFWVTLTLHLWTCEIKNKVMYPSYVYSQSIMVELA